MIMVTTMVKTACDLGTCRDFNYQAPRLCGIATPLVLIALNVRLLRRTRKSANREQGIGVTHLSLSTPKRHFGSRRSVLAVAEAACRRTGTSSLSEHISPAMFCVVRGLGQRPGDTAITTRHAGSNMRSKCEARERRKSPQAKA